MDASDGASDGTCAGCADKPLSGAKFQFLVETGVKALTEASWEFEDAVVCHQDDDVTGGVEDGGADFAGF